MSGPEWIELLNLIPEDQHSQLNVMCRSGVELSIDAIMRTERSFLVYRGRVVGTTDDGRVFFTPYSEITSLYLNRFVKENEVDDLFDFDGTQAPEGSSAKSHPTEDESSMVATPTAVIPPPPAAPLVFPPVGKTASGLVPRVTAAPGVMPPQKPKQSSGKVPTVAASAPVPPAHPPIPKAPAFMPPPPIASQDAANKGSILDRLRAQRSGPPGRKSGG